MLVALTGGIGSGKTTVATLFKELNIPVISADQITRDLVLPNSHAYNLIVKRFGLEILNSDQTIERRKLREIIFQDPEQRRWLEQLLHPLVEQYIQQQYRQIMQKSAESIKSTATLAGTESRDAPLTSTNTHATTPPYCIVEIPLLLESASPIHVDYIIGLDCHPDLQIARTMARDHSSAEQAKKIMASQVSRATRLASCNKIIDNNGSLQQLKHQVKSLHDELLNVSTE